MSNDNWGDNARIGVFIVGAEVVPEAEWWAMAPPGVSIHAARISAPTPWAKWQPDHSGVEICTDLERGATQFASMALSAVVVGHSSSSIMGGSGWDEAVIERVGSISHPSTQVTTNGLDCVQALRACSVKRPFLMFPPWFNEGIVSAGAAFFQGHGFQPPSSFRHIPEPKWANFRPEHLYRERMHIAQKSDLLMDQIIANCPDTADSVLIVGTGLRCVGIISALETALGKPVVTANQASLWRCLGLAGVETPVRGYGKLLEGARTLG
ncbi:MAG: hypothetical protein AB8B85_02385 [Paracoccaceae bacterium]